MNCTSCVERRLVLKYSRCSENTLTRTPPTSTNARAAGIPERMVTDESTIGKRLRIIVP